MTRAMRTLLGCLAALTLLLAASGAAAADHDAAYLSEKLPGGVLLLSDGVRVQADADTRIADSEGNKMSLASIPTPEQARPAKVLIDWTGRLTGQAVKADRIVVRMISE